MYISVMRRIQRGNVVIMKKKLYKLMNWPLIEEIIYSESDNPHAVLGPHRSGTQTLIQAYFPGAKKVKIVCEDTGETVQMELADEDGFFAALLPGTEVPAYHYVVRGEDNADMTCGDPYRYPPLITQKDTDKFKNGIHYTVYEKLGAHPMEIQGVKGTYFAVWAPNALRVSVVGDFNHWDGRVHQMRRLWDSGIFEIFVPGVLEGDNYKFELKLKGERTYLKADPYGNAAELRPDTASVVADLREFDWEDDEFVKNRLKFQTGNVPVSVYELYLGSFLQAGEGELYANYRDIADSLVPYIKKMGYTHVELMPVMEHPLDASWGYQVIGYYAPTARYGAPRDFMYLVNELHKAGIGVILDWVPSQFPADDHGLSCFDGTCLYEHQDPRQGVHHQWGTLIYNYGRPEVSNYLIANALFWVEKYHVDGIRMNAVASMLNLDYGKGTGQWIPNIYGGKENLEAVELIKHINSIMKKRNQGVLTIVEESTGFPELTGDLTEDGLGFDLKWNAGFMNDYLRYIQYDPYFRSHHHGELTFSMIYAYSEKFMLAFSHDEVVHGKFTFLSKMPGDRAQKLANLRLSYSYMMTHPGKKLLFMGQDIGEPDEWNENRLVDWKLMSEEDHGGVAALVSDLNRIYRENPEMYILDDCADGFEWINNISGNESYLTFLRRGKEKDQVLLVVANFSGIERQITTGVPYDGKYREIFNSDSTRYGGSGLVNSRVKHARDIEWDDRPNSIKVNLAPLSVSILRYIPYTKDELAQMKKQEKEREKKAAEAKRQAEKKAAEKAALKAAAKAAAQEAARKVLEAAEKKAAKKMSAKEKGKNKID